MRIFRCAILAIGESRESRSASSPWRSFSRHSAPLRAEMQRRRPSELRRAPGRRCSRPRMRGAIRPNAAHCSSGAHTRPRATCNDSRCARSAGSSSQIPATPAAAAVGAGSCSPSRSSECDRANPERSARRKCRHRHEHTRQRAAARAIRNRAGPRGSSRHRRSAGPRGIPNPRVNSPGRSRAGKCRRHRRVTKEC